MDWLAGEGGRRMNERFGRFVKLDLTEDRQRYDFHFHLPPSDAQNEESHLAAAFMLSAISMMTHTPMDEGVGKNSLYIGINIWL